MPHHEDAKQSSTEIGGKVFLGILVALALSISLDSFFKDVALLKDLHAVWATIRIHPGRSILYISQFLIFLLTLVRFYLGAYRYQDEEKESQGARDFMINLFGAIFVFIVLYVAGILIRTTTLFYLALFLIHLVDLAWFLCVMRFLSLGDGLRKVSRQFILLDSLTLAALFAIGILDFFCGPHRIYLYQFASLIVVVAAGIWDFVSLWPFYMNQKDWQHHILFQKRTSH